MVVSTGRMLQMQRKDWWQLSCIWGQILPSGMHEGGKTTKPFALFIFIIFQCDTCGCLLNGTYFTSGGKLLCEQDFKVLSLQICHQ